MILNYPWKIYKDGTFNLLTYHYIGEDKTKAVGDDILTVKGTFTIKRISEETREIWI